MVIHHRASILFCALSVFIFSTIAQAAEYNSLSDCRRFFDNANPGSTQEQLDAICKPKMDPIVFCTQFAVAEHFKGVTHTPEQKAAVTAQYQQACNASRGAPVALMVAGAGTPAAAVALSPECAAVPACVSIENQRNQKIIDLENAKAACGDEMCKATKTAEIARTNSLATQEKNTAVLNAQAEQRAQQQAQANQQAADQQQQNTNNNVMGSMLRTLPSVMAGMGQDGESAAQSGSSNSNSAAQQEVPDFSPQAETQAVADGTAATSQIGQTADAARPAVGNTVDKVTEATEKNDSNVASDPTTQGEGTKNLSDFQKELQQTANPYSTGFTSITFIKTGTAFSIEAIKPLIKTYEETQELCSTKSAKTETLCVEGSSPGAKAARTLMDVAGPMMLMMNSAQKACSATSKVSNLAGMGLTAANGVCMASKMKCENLCKTAMKKLEEAFTAVKAKTGEAFTADYNEKKKQCDEMSAMAVPPAPSPKDACNTKLTADVAKAKPKVESGNQAIESVFKRHQDKGQTGTPAAMLAKCEKKARNILGMLANIASLMAAKKSADDCEKKLAANGAAGNALSAKQYCEDSANSGTQFCKCQSNSTAAGCPGAIAAGAGVGAGENPNDQAGSNIRPNSGLSNFAGGGANGAGKGSSDYGLGNNKGEAGEYNPFAGGPGSGGGAGGPAGINSVGGGSGGQGSAGEATAKKKSDEDDKKWSFGAMAAGVSSMFGGNKGGAAGNGNLKEGNTLDAKIERRIASDKYGTEVTPASGISNWDKVHRTVIRVENTLIRGSEGGL